MLENKNFEMSQRSSDLLHIIYNCIPRSFMEIYSHFLYTWKTKKKKFLIDAHTNTGVRIYWHARFRQKLVIFLQGEHVLLVHRGRGIYSSWSFFGFKYCLIN